MCQDIQLYTRHALDSTPRAAPKTSMAIRGGQGLALLTKCRSKSKCRTLDGECVSDCTVSIAEGRSVASWLCCLALASTVACLLGGSNASLTAAGFAESPANVPDWAALALGGWTRGETLATACGSAAVTVGVACWWRGSLAREPPGNAVSVMALCTARTLTERRPPYRRGKCSCRGRGAWKTGEQSSFGLPRCRAVAVGMPRALDPSFGRPPPTLCALTLTHRRARGAAGPDTDTVGTADPPESSQISIRSSSLDSLGRCSQGGIISGSSAGHSSRCNIGPTVFEGHSSYGLQPRRIRHVTHSAVAFCTFCR
jgi:hypothetical protein